MNTVEQSNIYPIIFSGLNSFMEVRGSFQIIDVRLTKSEPIRKLCTKQKLTIRCVWRVRRQRLFRFSGNWHLEVRLLQSSGGEFSVARTKQNFKHMREAHVYDRDIVIHPQKIILGLYRVEVTLKLHYYGHHDVGHGVISGKAVSDRIQFYSPTSFEKPKNIHSINGSF